MLLLKARTYKPWIGQLPSKATELLWTLANREITSEILSFELVRHCGLNDKDDNFIHPDYLPINIRYIFFSWYLHFSLNVCCNHSIHSPTNCCQHKHLKQKPYCKVWPYSQ